MESSSSTFPIDAANFVSFLKLHFCHEPQLFSELSQAIEEMLTLHILPLNLESITYRSYPVFVLINELFDSKYEIYADDEALNDRIEYLRKISSLASYVSDFFAIPFASFASPIIEFQLGHISQEAACAQIPNSGLFSPFFDPSVLHSDFYYSPSSGAAEYLHKMELARLISIRDEDISLLHKFPRFEPQIFQTRDFPESLSSTIDFRELNKFGFSYYDMVDDIDNLSFSGSSTSDDFVVNRRMVLLSSPINSEEKEPEAEARLRHDFLFPAIESLEVSDNTVERCIQSLINPLSHRCEFLNSITQIYEKKADAFFSTLYPFDEVMGQIFDLLVKQNIDRTRQFSSSFDKLCETYTNCFPCFSKISNSVNYLVDNYTDQYQKIEATMEKTLLCGIDDAIDNGEAGQAIGTRGMELQLYFGIYFRRFIREYYYPKYIKPSSSLIYAAVDWNRIMRYYINKAAKSVFDGKIEADTDNRLSEAVKALLKVRVPEGDEEGSKAEIYFVLSCSESAAQSSTGNLQTVIFEQEETYE